MPTQFMLCNSPWFPDCARKAQQVLCISKLCARAIHAQVILLHCFKSWKFKCNDPEEKSMQSFKKEKNNWEKSKSNCQPIEDYPAMVGSRLSLTHTHTNKTNLGKSYKTTDERNHQVKLLALSLVFCKLGWTKTIWNRVFIRCQCDPKTVSDHIALP